MGTSFAANAAVMLVVGMAAAGEAQPTARSTAIFGEVRSRTELDRPGEGVSTDAFSLLRTRLGLRVQPAPDARVLLQIQDSRVLGTSAATAPAGADVLDLHQAYVELDVGADRSPMVVRVGRQEIALGNERLVGAVNWSNTGRSFDGARVFVGPAGDLARWSGSAFVAMVEERGRRFGTTPGIGAPDHAVAGAFLTRKLGETGVLETTALFDGPMRYRTYFSARRTTLDARLRTSRLAGLPATVDVEGAYQFGTQRHLPNAPALPVSQTVGAYLVGARISTLPASDRRWSLSAGADLVSGDDNPTDGTYGAFWTAYATNHPFYGAQDVIGDPATSTRERGLIDVLAVGVLPLGSTTLRAEAHRFQLATGSPRPLGWELDVSVPVRLGAFRLDGGFSAFVAQSGAAAVGLAADGARLLWGYVQLTAPF